MEQQARFIAWGDLEPDLQEGKGTLIVEQGAKQPVRLWWTKDDIPLLAPMPLPTDDELDYLGLTEPHPFVIWCFEHYLNPQTGKAMLTKPAFSYPPGLISSSTFRKLYPSLSVVLTVRLDSVATTRA